MNLPLYRIYSDQLIQRLPRSVKLVTWHDDLRRQMHPALPEVLNRSDAVISVLREAVLCPEQFPEIRDKLWRLPWFVPEITPDYPVNSQPIMQCLLPGAVQRRRPLRWRAVQEVPHELLMRLEHPGYGKLSYDTDSVGDRFYDLIHKYACCLTDGGIYRYAVAKYVEVPYSGSLLIAEDLPDLTEMGFRAGEHFLGADMATDLGELVRHVLSHLDDYYAVRWAGQQLVRELHTERVRRSEALQVSREILSALGLQ